MGESQSLEKSATLSFSLADGFSV